MSIISSLTVVLINSGLKNNVLTKIFILFLYYLVYNYAAKIRRKIEKSKAFKE